MSHSRMRFVVSMSLVFCQFGAGVCVAGGLAAAVADSRRSADFVARDSARHPLEELAFFGLRPNQTVVEIWPGAGYWTEILAPFLRDGGTLYAALPVTRPGQHEYSSITAWRKTVAGDAMRFDKVQITQLGTNHLEVAPAGSADLILTFRNLHNWMSDGFADRAFAAFYKALKPGGVLGIEEHRGSADKPQDPKGKDGYVREDYTLALAKKAGFELIGRSEINANPKDTKNWPKGVWTLPPVLALGEQDRAKYIGIGEADNFVLKFRKPYH
jgi:predicted methyltransferase